MNLIYRKATSKDIEPIAQLHARSWQQTYRGIYTDNYLDNEVVNDRQSVWKERLTSRTPNQWVLVATDETSAIKGFVSVYGDQDPQWGALVDNLHVQAEIKGQGVGAALLIKAADHIEQEFPLSGMFLWVYEANSHATAFYERLGGVKQELVTREIKGKDPANTLRYIWTKGHFPKHQ